MKIGLQNLEPKYKNYALEKLRAYHTLKGDECFDYMPEKADSYCLVYCSSIFTFTDKSTVAAHAVCGGTGFDVKSKLPDEIDGMRPKCNYGFCSRGCIRNCPFCVVREKEGYIKAEADIYDIWDGQSKEITLYDNNILALPEHFKRVCGHLHKERIKVDFNQGLDIRLIDTDIAELLSTKYIRHAEYHFAFDYSYLDSLVEEKVKILKNQGINRNTFYVLTGFPDGKSIKEDIEDALYRLNLLKSLGQNAYVMRYRKITNSQPESLITEDTYKYYIPLANWGSVHAAFKSMDFLTQYFNHPRGIRYRKHYQELGLIS